ncbi:MAG: helix-turn-helix domain-containing protein, partial [Ginsengibacter sp.]
AKYLKAFKAKHNGSLNGQTNNFKWLQQFIRVFSVFQVLWFIFLIPYVIPKYSNKLLDAVDWYPIYIPLAIMIYWLGIKGYAVSQGDNITIKKPGTVNSTLSAAIIQHTISSLKKVMDSEKLYLNPNLNLNMLAEHTAITQKIISAVLNQHLDKSFNEFINEYRVECFKQKILQPEMENFTIAGIALECGFNSLATFQRTFKQITGMSPSEFRNAALQVQ